MRKAMALILALVLVFALVPMSVSARTLTDAEKALFEELKVHIEFADGHFELPDDVITQGMNYVAALDKELTEAQITEIKTQVDAAIAVVKKEASGDVDKWSTATKDAILEKVDNAAKVVGCSATTDTKGHIVVRDAQGKEVVKNDELIKVTGFGAESVVITGLCTLAVLCAVAFVSKKVELF